MISLRLDRFDFVSAVEGFARGSHLRQHVWEQIVYPSIPQMCLDEMDFLWYVFRRDLWDNYFYNMNGRIAPSPGHKDYLHTLAALNEGWKPQFTEDEERWYPWFTLWTEEELSEKSDEWKADRHLISTGDYSRDYAGFSYSLSYTAPSDTYTYAVSRLCFKSEALATYCGKQFISLWADFNMIKK